MSGFDANRVYSIGVHDRPATSAPESASETERLLLDFLLQYRVGGEFIYRSVGLACRGSAESLTLLVVINSVETYYSNSINLRLISAM